MEAEGSGPQAWEPRREDSLLAAARRCKLHGARPVPSLIDLTPPSVEVFRRAAGLHSARGIVRRLGGAVEGSYAVWQTTPEGELRLFSVGTYLDRVGHSYLLKPLIVHEGEVARFAERLVVMDTGGVYNLLATPI